MILKYTLLTLLYIFLLLVSIASTAAEVRANSIYPIWSELSYFERSTLSDLHKSRSNHPDALLALYLVASGSRELSPYDTAKANVKTFIKAVKTMIVDEENQELTGDVINREMHSQFFLKGDTDNIEKGYSADQSRLDEIFESGVFNCISSSLLYVVLARHFDLDVEGVLLPSHAFIQLNVRGGRAIDIETTSPNGFDQKHDEAFYKKQNSDWFSSRNLDPASYQDYLQRDFVTPTELAAKNMLNQHTGLGEMDIKHSGRLAEISAYINPTNLLANEKRLYFYATEIHQLITNEKWPTLLRLYNTTYQQTLKDSLHFNNAESLQHNLQLYLSGAMLAYAKAGNIEQTLTVMGELISRGLKAPENQKEIDDRVINSVKILLTELAEQERYNEGLLALSLIEGHLSSPSAWPDMLSWFYLRWAKKYWDVKDWQEVIHILSEYIDHPAPALDDAHINKAIGDAYTNWVIDTIQNKDLKTANTIVETCIDSGLNKVCSSAQATLQKEQKNWGSH